MGNMDALMDVKGVKFAWGPSRLIDAALDRLESLSHKIDKGVYGAYLTGYKRLSEMESKGRSVVLAAIKAPLYELGLDMGDRIAYVRIPPTYIVPQCHLNDADCAVNEAFGSSVAIRAPFKTLAVALGLGQYGKNNVVYVPGMGSFVRLRCYLAEDDNGTSSDKCLQFLAHGFGASFMAQECDGCGICAASCPTSAVLADGFIVDAGKCVTYANEEPGPFPSWIGHESHNCMVGCMRCQEPCPINAGMLEIIRLNEVLDMEETGWLLSGGISEEGRVRERITEKLAGLGIDYSVEVIRRNLKALYIAGRLS